MKIVIVGAGAIGKLFGALLSKAGHEIVFVELLTEIVEAINQRGVGLLEIGANDPDDVAYTPARAVVSAAAIDDCDAVILTVKSFDTLAAVKSVAHLIGAAAPVITLQTGLGNLELMEKVVPRRDIVVGFTYMAGTALGPARVRQGGAGKTYIGRPDGQMTAHLEKLSRAFNAAGIPAQIIPDIVAQLWGKVIVFSAINPVSAVLRVRNGELPAKPDAVSLLKRLIAEGLAVAETCAVKPAGLDLEELLFDICRETADNMSSMLQDLVNGRRTEIEALNGAICRLGAAHGLPVATHLTLLELIRLLEERRRQPGEPQ